jgi:predicted DNA-binding transcriptional regulator AlpA
MTQPLNPEIFFLNVAQVARRYSVSTDTIWRWSNTGDLPRPVKIGGSTRWRLSDLIEHEGTLKSCFSFCLDLVA